jgi:NAD(P)-dependent dehydrogenase (short-subunit alcohol dehydrogenase family)
MTSANPTTGTPIEGAVALVTGGHRGFGRAVVEELLERGATKIYVTALYAQLTAA